jgi:CheY-like chemotaxis protein
MARPTDTNALVTELVPLASSTLGRRIRVEAELTPEPWLAMVDPSQLEASILNLCLNARDAMPEGGQLTITTANVTRSEQSHPDDPPVGDFVQIRVADTGVGMSAEVKRRAFDPFYTTKGPRGSGLGLSQVYGMARQSGGTVWIDSTPNQGTLVSLLLPRALETQEADSAMREDATPALPQPPIETVLVVDDDNAVRVVTVEMLRDLRCEVIEAASGAEALTLLAERETPPSVALLDYAMPGMTGLELARQLRDRGYRMPIGLVTGYAEIAEADAKARLLDGLLRKPFTLRELRGLLTRLRERSVDRPILQAGQ